MNSEINKILSISPVDGQNSESKSSAKSERGARKGASGPCKYTITGFRGAHRKGRQRAGAGAYENRSQEQGRSKGERCDEENRGRSRSSLMREMRLR